MEFADHFGDRSKESLWALLSKVNALVSDDTIAGDNVSKGVEWRDGACTVWRAAGPLSPMFLHSNCRLVVNRSRSGILAPGATAGYCGSSLSSLLVAPSTVLSDNAADRNFPASWKSPHRGLNKDSPETRQDCFSTETIFRPCTHPAPSPGVSSSTAAAKEVSAVRVPR